jgi:polysaccharide biosynthesis protein PslH
MRILFFVPYTPNLIRVRSFNLIRHLSSRGHEVTVATLVSSESERTDAVTLADHCHEVVELSLPSWRSVVNCALAVPTKEPLQAAFCWENSLARQIGQLLYERSGRPQFDVVHVEHLRGAKYGLYFYRQSADNPHRIPVVWDSVDCISSLFEQAAANSRSVFGRWMTRFELGRTRRFEGYLVRQFDRVLVTSPADKQALLDLVPPGHHSTPVSVLPNGVDLAYFEPPMLGDREPVTVVVSGKMSYHANVTMVLHMVREVMPLIWARRPEVRLVIVGKDPPREILDLAHLPAVSVTGTVADIRPYLQQATIAVAPLTYGAGIQNKVLEAMACATPVVTTSQAAKSLKAVDRQDFIVADVPAAFAEEVLALLADQWRQRAIGEAGRVYVETFHNWATIAAQLEDVYVGAAVSS